MVGGSLVVGLCLLVLGWTSEIVGIFVSEPGMVSARERSTIWAKSYKRDCRLNPARLLWPYSAFTLSILQSTQVRDTHAEPNTE